MPADMTVKSTDRAATGSSCREIMAGKLRSRIQEYHVKDFITTITVPDYINDTRLERLTSLLAELSTYIPGVNVSISMNDGQWGKSFIVEMRWENDEVALNYWWWATLLQRIVGHTAISEAKTILEVLQESPAGHGMMWDGVKTRTITVWRAILSGNFTLEQYYRFSQSGAGGPVYAYEWSR